MRALGMLLLVALVVAPRAAVAAPAHGIKPEARVHLERGLKLYDRQRYDEAIAELRAGLAIDPQPDLLYALGQAERRRGNCQRALEYYQSCLALVKDPASVAALRVQIERCRVEEDENARRGREAEPPAAAATTPSPPTGATAEPPARDATHDSASREATPRESTARETTARETTARDVTARESAAHEPTAHESITRETAARETTARETTARESAMREPTPRAPTAREPAKEPPPKESAALPESDDDTTAAPAPAAAAVTRPLPPHWYRDGAGLTLTAVGLAGLAAGAALVGVARARLDVADQTYQQYADARGAPALWTAGIVVLAAGGALTLGGIIRLGVVAARRSHAEAN